MCCDRNSDVRSRCNCADPTLSHSSGKNLTFASHAKARFVCTIQSVGGPPYPVAWEPSVWGGPLEHVPANWNRSDGGDLRDDARRAAPSVAAPRSSRPTRQRPQISPSFQVARAAGIRVVPGLARCAASRGDRRLAVCRPARSNGVIPIDRNML